MTEPAGLRERKKLETRQRISDAATFLFATRGFDRVSVAEIAEAANVSKMTVFNYFPRKEDLFFDRVPELLDLLTETVRGRHPGESPLAALRRVLRDQAREGHPLGGLSDDFVPFWRVVLGAPPLQARAREIADEVEAALAGLLAEGEGDESGSSRPRLAAALIVAAYRATYMLSARRLLGGERAAAVRPDHLALLDRSFAAVEHALAAL